MSVSPSSVGIGDQNARDVERHVAVANNNGPGARQVGRLLLKIRMRVVPADEVDGRDAAGQILAGNVQRAVGLRADGVDDGVVALGEFGRLDVFAHHHVAEKAEAGVFGDLFELFTDRLDLRVVGRDAGAHQPPRRRQHLQHVDDDADLLGRVGRLQQRCGGEETRRSGADDGDMVWAHTQAFCSCPAAWQGAENGCRFAGAGAHDCDSMLNAAPLVVTWTLAVGQRAGNLVGCGT